MAARSCLRLFVHIASGIAHTHTGTVYENYECVRVYFSDKELCKHEFTSGGHYCPGPGASYPSGTSLVQSFLLVTLPVTSTSMRYDRYDTCLHVCLRTRTSSITRECFADSDEPADIGEPRFRRRFVIHARIIFHARNCKCEKRANQRTSEVKRI